jgi:aryl-alcohol dehydrogenase-like predicted oxidoreductase
MKNEADDAVSRLVLGTAQLGMTYGIANRTGQPDIKTATRIIETAWDHGIREFDTAQAYGESEAILGEALATLNISDQARIITKLAPQLDPRDISSLRNAVAESMERLRVPSHYILMLHRESWLDSLDGGLKYMLQEYVSEGVARYIGLSVYSPEKALQALDLELFNMIQVPANIFDRRFADAGVFQKAEEQGKQAYVRSVFLQGLLLMNADNLPHRMSFAKPDLALLERLCQKYHLSRQQISLIYAKQRYPAAKIIFGAESAEQVKQNVETWKGTLTDTIMKEIEDAFGQIDEILTDPTRWPV